ncbi:MAG TPA: DUF4388 domain-containing protein [Oculatellaceae cyanobacterium]
MLKKLGIAPLSHRLPAQPGLAELYHFLSQAMEKPGKQVEISWFNANRKKLLILHLNSNINLRDPSWQLMVQEGAKREILWQHYSCDVLLILNLILTCGVQEEPQQDLQAARGRRAALRHSAAHFACIEENHQEHGGGVLAELFQLPPRQPQASPTAFPMQGQLADTPIQRLLRLLAESKATGKLLIRSEQREAAVFLSHGNLIHATIYAVFYDLIGDDAISEVATWVSGSFQFEPGTRSKLATVHLELEQAFARASSLNEKLIELENFDFASAQAFSKVEPAVAQEDFYNRVKINSPLDPELLYQIYEMVDGLTSAQEIAEEAGVKRHKMIDALHYLNQEQLIEKHCAKSSEASEAKLLDRKAIESVLLSLRSPETGLYTFAAFQYFIEEEYFRSYRLQSPLTVLIFEVNSFRSNQDRASRRVLTRASLVDIAARVSRAKRHVDILANCEMNRFALLLPNTGARGALILVNKIKKALTSSLLKGFEAGEEVEVHFGLNSIPEHGVDVNTIISKASATLEEGKRDVR